MKKWVKWTLGVVAAIILIIAAFVVWNWGSIAILGGTEEIAWCVQGAACEPPASL